MIREPAAPAILGPATDSEITRKPRASCSRIRRLRCSAWKACGSPARTPGRTACWRYGRSPITRPQRRARSAARSLTGCMRWCWPGRGTCAGPVIRWTCGGSRSGASAATRPACARRSPSRSRSCRRGAGSRPGCASRPPMRPRNGGSLRRRRPGTPESPGRPRTARSPPPRTRRWTSQRHRWRTWASTRPPRPDPVRHRSADRGVHLACRPVAHLLLRPGRPAGPAGPGAGPHRRRRRAVAATGPVRMAWAQLVRQTGGPAAVPRRLLEEAGPLDLDDAAEALVSAGPRLIVVNDVDRRGPGAVDALAGGRRTPRGPRPHNRAATPGRHRGQPAGRLDGDRRQGPPSAVKGAVMPKNRRVRRHRDTTQRPHVTSMPGQARRCARSRSGASRPAPLQGCRRGRRVGTRHYRDGQVPPAHRAARGGLANTRGIRRGPRLAMTCAADGCCGLHGGQ